MSVNPLSKLSESYVDLVDFLLYWLSRLSYVDKRKKMLALTYTDRSECISTFHEGIQAYQNMECKYQKKDLDQEVQTLLSQLYHMIPTPRNPQIQNNKKSVRTRNMRLFLVDLGSAFESLLSSTEEIPQAEWNDFLSSLFNLDLFYGKTTISNKKGINSDERSLYSKEHLLESSNHIFVIHRWTTPCVYHERQIMDEKLTVKDLLVSFFEIKSGKHDLWYELFCKSICEVNARSIDLIRQEIQCIKESLYDLPLFEPQLSTLIHDYAYSKQEMSITATFDHGS